MAAQRSADRPRPTLLILLVAALTLLTLQFRGFQPLDAFQQGVRDILSPVRSLVDRMTDPVETAWNGIFGYEDLLMENDRLQVELARMRGRLLTDEADAELLDRLLHEVDIAYTDLETAVVRILGTPPGNFSTHTIEVDKGSDDGLEEGMAVVTGAGLVGRLQQVDRSRSVVQLATHPDFRVGVRLVASQDEGLARGTGVDGLVRIESGIRTDAVVALDEVVVTSGGRSLFPADIPVGRVLDPDDGADYGRSITVGLAARLENLSFLNVLARSPGDRDSR
ncbi:MAG TPA: rod shape-determining protein MreC [Acidimicrobiia bacterium]|nr:rod shape-determining protein MreC [Acidimicrobiia bacterium]